MSLINQSDKFVILSKRQSSFMDEKTGELKEFKYVSGFNPVTNQVMNDVAVDATKQGSIKWGDLLECGAYDVQYNTRSDKNKANSLTISGVSFFNLFGSIELKTKK